MKCHRGILTGLLLASLTLLTLTPQADAAHPKPGEYGYRGIQFNPAMAGIPLLDYFTASPIKPAGPAVNGQIWKMVPGIQSPAWPHEYDIHFPDRPPQQTRPGSL